MKFENSFTVRVPVDEAWRVILDVPSVAPCFPGATLLEQIDDSTYSGTVSVKLGPMALSFKGVAQIVERDEGARTVLVRANGSDTKGRGKAKADAHFALTPAPNGTRVMITTDLALMGAVAQFSRGAMVIQEVASGLIEQFEINLNSRLSGSVAEVSGQLQADDVRAMTAPATDNSIGAGLMWRIVKRLLRRMAGRTT